MTRNKDIFYDGDVVEITGRNVKEKYRGMRGKVIRWHHDNVYTIRVFTALSDVDIVLYGSEMILVK